MVLTLAALLHKMVRTLQTWPTSHSHYVHHYKGWASRLKLKHAITALKHTISAAKHLGR
jgi:hypothetical protein